MFRITKRIDLTDQIVETRVEAPLIAKTAKPGHFVLVRGDERGERIPLTIADSDAESGEVTLVMQVVGQGTRKLGAFREGEAFLDVVGPLGRHRDIPGEVKFVCCVAGGLGVAPMYPQAKAYHEAGSRVVSIVGARTRDLFFWQDKMEAASESVHYGTDDGSFGFHGFAAQILDRLIQGGEKFDEVVAIGPVPHMKAVAQCCMKHGVPVVVSLNPIMVDGTGMCGGCRVTVGGEVKYACVDGPEFDGAAVDFDELIARQQAYRSAESRAVQSEASETAPVKGHLCRLQKWVEDHEEALARKMPQADDGATEEKAMFALVQAMAEMMKQQRSFDEVARGMSPEEAVAEASRCLVCKKPKCTAGCPVEINIPLFIKAIQDSDFAEAARILKDKNNLPAICGRVCPQETQCEQLCVLGKKGTPVAIGALERFVADWEAAHEQCEPEVAPRNGRKVAVVGSGPGGLTCAGDLAKMGYDVTIFEAFHDTGGVLRYGIPEFRLPKEIVGREVAYVKSLGVEIKCNMVIGKVLTIDDLMRDGYEATFIAVGAGAPMFMRIPGENLVGVFSANEFLTRVNLMKAYRADEYDTPVLVGEKVVVVGAGNVAMDAARVAIRLGSKSVSIVYRRSRTEIPARAAEVKHAEEEGVQFMLLTNPVRILGDEQNRVAGIECIRMELGEPDASGRRRPIAMPGTEFAIECDMVIPALGTLANPLLTSSTEGLELNKWGNIVVKPETCESSIPGVYAGGDIVTGAATVIEAMGAGKTAAKAIDEYLRQQSLSS